MIAQAIQISENAMTGIPRQQMSKTAVILAEYINGAITK
jgi:hypothetical protein